MSFRILAHLVRDHARLDELFAAVSGGRGEVDPDAWEAFRGWLLRHMELEERIVLPALHRVAPDKTASEARRLRVDHTAVRALLAQPPGRAVVAQLAPLLAAHHRFEEAPGGIHELADRYLADEAGDLVALMRAYAPSTPPPRPPSHRPASDDAVTARAMPRVCPEDAERRTTPGARAGSGEE